MIIHIETWKEITVNIFFWFGDRFDRPWAVSVILKEVSIFLEPEVTSWLSHYSFISSFWSSIQTDLEKQPHFTVLPPGRIIIFQQNRWKNHFIYCWGKRCLHQVMNKSNKQINTINRNGLHLSLHWLGVSSWSLFSLWKTSGRGQQSGTHSLHNSEGFVGKRPKDSSIIHSTL